MHGDEGLEDIKKRKYISHCIPICICHAKCHNTVTILNPCHIVSLTYLTTHSFIHSALHEYTYREREGECVFVHVCVCAFLMCLVACTSTRSLYLLAPQKCPCINVCVYPYSYVCVHIHVYRESDSMFQDLQSCSVAAGCFTTGSLHRYCGYRIT